MTRLILVRHAETPANQEFRYISVQDHALSKRGQLQAEHLANTLGGLSLAEIYCSPSRRARDTALAIAARCNQTVHEVGWLRECNFGAWEGLSRAEIEALSPEDAERLFAWERDTSIAAPGGESFETLRERVVSGAVSVIRARPADTVVLVSHVGPIKVLLCEALGAPLTSIFNVFLDTASITIVDWTEKHTLVRLVNCTTHLEWPQAWAANTATPPW